MLPWDGATGHGDDRKDRDKKRNTDALTFFKPLGFVCPISLNQNMGFSLQILNACFPAAVVVQPMTAAGLWAEMGEGKKEGFPPHSPAGKSPFAKSSGEREEKGGGGGCFFLVCFSSIPTM